MNKILSASLLAAGLFALAGCGGASDDAANNVSTDLYNIAPDDLGTENLIGNEAVANEILGNETGLDSNLTETGADANSVVNAQ